MREKSEVVISYNLPRFMETPMYFTRVDLGMFIFRDHQGRLCQIWDWHVVERQTLRFHACRKWCFQWTGTASGRLTQGSLKHHCSLFWSHEIQELVVDLPPLWKIMEFVSWEYDPNIWKVIKFHGSKPPISHRSWNIIHQPTITNCYYPLVNVCITMDNHHF